MIYVTYVENISAWLPCWAEDIGGEVKQGAVSR